MVIKYNVTGAKRKELVQAVCTLIKMPLNYKGAPTFAYEVGEYRIDKDGTLTGKDDLDLEDALHQQGFDAVEREYEEPDTCESGLGGMGAADEPPAFEDLQMDGREELGLGRTRRDNYRGENGMQASDVPEPEDSDTLTIEMPLDGFTEESITNLKKMVASKAKLIRKAIGADELPIERTDTMLRFPWFRFDADGETVNAYARFIGALCAAAKAQKRVNAKEADDVENEKFAFRVFLIRLGFVGDDYRAARRVLLKNLSGNSAFKSVSRIEGGTKL